MDFKKLAIVGGSLVGAGALFYYLYKSGKTENVKASGKTLTREVIINTLKQLKKELFTVCVQMSLMAAEMKKYSQGRLDYDIKDFIFSYPTINQEMQTSIKRAYDKNNVTEADFQYNCEVTFADDQEIQTMVKSVKQMVDNAAEGKQMDVETEIPEFLTQEKVLEIIQKIMVETTKAMQQMFKKIKDQYGELNLNDPRIHRQLQGLQADEIKSNIFNEYNLEDFDDPAQKIIQFATQKYAQEQPEFQEKMMQLELKQRKSMEIIMQNPDNEEIVDKVFNEPSQSLGGGMGMGGGAFPGFHANRRKNQASTEEVKKEQPAQAEAKTEEVKAEVNAEEKSEEKVEEQVEEKVEVAPVEEQQREETSTVEEKVEEQNKPEEQVEQKIEAPEHQEVSHAEERFEESTVIVDSEKTQELVEGENQN